MPPARGRRAASKQSAGILLFRRSASGLEVFLVHPGGPFFRNKDDGAWSIPKGEYGDEEDPLTAARREFKEETGVEPSGEFIPLSSVRQAGGKNVFAWGVEGDLDPAQLRSNTFEMELPKGSGRMHTFPEVDRGEWFAIATARRKINGAQKAFLDRLADALRTG
jgi:predicted NUDIX family NTP pyrophosphohydrolase